MKTIIFYGIIVIIKDLEVKNVEIKFNDLIFEIKNDRVLLNDRSFVEIQVCGENKPTHLGAKMTNSSEGDVLPRLLARS